RLVLIGKPTIAVAIPAGLLHLLQRPRVILGDLGVEEEGDDLPADPAPAVIRGARGWEEKRDDLPADLAAEFLEHQVALVAVLDERILLRHRAEVDTLAEVIHVLEVLAPACVDDLEDHVALDLPRNLLAPGLLPLSIFVLGGLAEVIHERLA